MNAIAKNTLMLYFRQIVVLLVGLYTVRVILNILGADDYGIYCVVAGVVTMLTFLSGSMATVSQRFLAFEIGRGDFDKLKKTFAISGIVYILIALVAVLILETIGLWFINYKLTIPKERFETVSWLYQFSILSFLCTIMTTPYISAVIAHEDMKIFAYVSTLEAFWKLGVVFLLQYLQIDKLFSYGFLLSLVSVAVLLMYAIICQSRYKECGFFFYWDKKMFQEIVSFTGWSLFGQLAVVFRNQAVTILLNQMFNPAVVAARAIAAQITNSVNSFSGNFNTGLYSPIIKSYAAGQNDQAIRYMFFGARITYFLMFIFSLPLVLEMQMILSLWLKNPPEYAVFFSQLSLIDGVINSVSLPLMTAARAPGNVRLYELSLGSILLVSFCVSLLVLHFGASPYSVMYVAISANILMFFVRLWIVRQLIPFSLGRFFGDVIVSALKVSFLSCAISVTICWMLPNNLPWLFIKLMACFFVTGLCIYFIGTTSNERKKMKNVVHHCFKCRFRND